METVATTAPVEVSQVVEIVYTEELESILSLLSLIADASVQVTGLLLFFVVVVLCYFVYKFFRIFF